MRFLLRWTNAVPVVAVLALAATWSAKPGPLVLFVVGLLLAGSVLAAVHHAEVVAHRVGEPFGSLVLAVAVTVIEVALIVTLMLSGGPETSTLARDTVFAAVMITCNGIVGLSLLIGTLKRGTASFNAEGTATALATVATLAGVSPATVSRVINGTPNVTAPVREAVEAAIEQLGYVPNRAARSLVTRRTDSIALVVREPVEFGVADPYLSSVVVAASQSLLGADHGDD